MIASHPVAGEDVEDRDEEKAESGGEKKNVEHGSAPCVLVLQRHNIGQGAYRFEGTRRRPTYKCRISAAAGRRRRVRLIDDQPLRRQDRGAPVATAGTAMGRTGGYEAFGS
jgi:hypothetical protein